MVADNQSSTLSLWLQRPSLTLSRVKTLGRIESAYLYFYANYISDSIGSAKLLIDLKLHRAIFSRDPRICDCSQCIDQSLMLWWIFQNKNK